MVHDDNSRAQQTSRRAKNSPPPLEHARQYAVWRAMAVDKGPDVDDDDLLYVGPALVRRAEAARFLGINFWRFLLQVINYVNYAIMVTCYSIGVYAP
jgi:hypothetical protein